MRNLLPLRFDEAYEQLDDLLEDGCLAAEVLATAVANGSMEFDSNEEPDLVRVEYVGTSEGKLHFNIETR